MSTGYVWHELYGWHDTGTYAGLLPASLTSQPYQHFESPESKQRFHSLVEVSGLAQHLIRIVPEPATEVDILRVHTPEHLARIKMESAQPKGGDAGDGTRTDASLSSTSESIRFEPVTRTRRYRPASAAAIV